MFTTASTALYADFFASIRQATRENEHDTTASELSHVVRSDSGAPQLNPEVVALLEAAQASCVADMRNTADAEVEIHTARGHGTLPARTVDPGAGNPHGTLRIFARIVAGGYWRSPIFPVC